MVINISDLENVKFNNNDVEKLIVDGVTVWEKILEADDESFNYVGIDANGNAEGVVVEGLDLPAYDGNPVEYRIGKYDNGWVVSGGFNGDYYGYDFSTVVSPHDMTQQIIPDNIVIPSRYKGKPVTGICPNAFSSGLDYVASGGSSQWSKRSQACYIKSVTLPKSIKFIGNKGLHLLEMLESDIVLPEGIITVIGGAFANCSQPSKKYILPSSVVFTAGSVASNPFVYDGVSSIDTHAYVYTVVVKSPTIELHTQDNSFSYAKAVVFENSVQSITGCLSYSNVSKAFVFKHSNSDTIELNLSGPKSATATNIYTDNDYIRNYDWASKNYTVTFYPLSDYVE